MKEGCKVEKWVELLILILLILTAVAFTGYLVYSAYNIIYLGMQYYMPYF